MTKSPSPINYSNAVIRWSNYFIKKLILKIDVNIRESLN